MRTPTPYWLVLASAVLLLTITVEAADSRPAVVPDATQAVIDGRVAVGAWPSRGGEIVGPEGFTVHLSRDDDLEDERVFPAGTWFQPPAGRYKVWLEGSESGEDGDHWITPSFTVLNYRGGPFRGRGFATTHEVVRAGRVKVHPEVEMAPDHSLRLLHLDPKAPSGKLARGFLRAVLPEDRQGPVLVPEGAVVGLVYDRRANRYLAASRPTSVNTRGMTPIHPTRRRGVSDLLVILQRPRGVDTAAEDDLALMLEGADGEERVPDVVVPTWEWVYAIWYDVDGRAAEVRAESSTSYLEPTEVVLEPGGVATLRGRLLPRPFVDVRLDLPSALKPEAATLEVYQAEPRNRIETRELPLAPETVTRIEGLPATKLELSLLLETKPRWRLQETVDLSPGEPREVVFRPRPIELSGTIYHGDEPTPGQVTIEVHNTKRLGAKEASFQAEVDDDGSYRATLYAVGRYFILVDLPGVPGPPAQVLHIPWIQEDTVFDLHIPKSSARIQVRDAASGQPIAGASVDVYNEFLIDWMEVEKPGSAPSWTTTDSNGWAQMPPLYPGSLAVRASKEGYREMDERLKVQLGKDENLELRVDLQPLGRTSLLRLLLPDGRPAVGAEVRAQALLWNEPPAWQGTADAEGMVRVPTTAEGAWLLIRHPQAGSWIQEWREDEGGPMPTWSLRASPGPIRLRAVGLDGEPEPWTPFAVRFPETWVAGAALAWLTHSPVAGAHRDGVWTASHLPAVPLAIYAGDMGTLSLAVHGLLAGTAVEIAPPWAGESVEVPVTTRR